MLRFEPASAGASRGKEIQYPKTSKAVIHPALFNGVRTANSAEASRDGICWGACDSFRANSQPARLFFLPGNPWDHRSPA